MRDRTTRRFIPRASAIAPLGGLVVLIAACGSRGPLDVDFTQTTSDADSGVGPGPGADASSVPPGDDTGPDASGVVDASADASADAPHEASLVNCGSCVLQSCGTKILACLTDPTCQQELQCIATTCLAGADGGGGGLGNIGCFTQCAGGDITKLTTLIGILQCITTSCGSDCGSVLGGLGGLGGGRAMDRETENAGRVIFSAFPEICGAR